MIGSGFALDAARRILRDAEARQDRLDQRHARRSRFARASCRKTLEAEPDAPSSGSHAGPISLDVLPQSKRICPGCEGRFVVFNVQGVNLDTCFSCGSIWFDAGELKALTHQSSDVPDKCRLAKRSKYNCPVCGTRMKQHLFKSPHRLLVDACPDGHGTYLEQGEYLKALQITEETITQQTPSGNRLKAPPEE